jgi:hypothetical protein
VARLDAAAVAALVSAGVLSGTADECRALPEARSWVRRQLLVAEPFADQHRQTMGTGAGPRINLDESPLARLAVGSRGAAPYLLPHQVEAGERLRRLVDRAHLQARVTMRYSSQPGGGGTADDIGDMALDARRRLADISRVLPADCAGVVLDVCGLLKGLQLVETERGWPKRSAKLVLRIGLEQLARHFGLTPEAVGAEGGRVRGWGETPSEVG